MAIFGAQDASLRRCVHPHHRARAAREHLYVGGAFLKSVSGAPSGSLVALDAQTGARLPSADAVGSGEWVSLEVAGDRLYVAAGALVVLDRRRRQPLRGRVLRRTLAGVERACRRCRGRATRVPDGPVEVVIGDGAGGAWLGVTSREESRTSTPPGGLPGAPTTGRNVSALHLDGDVLTIGGRSTVSRARPSEPGPGATVGRLGDPVRPRTGRTAGDVRDTPGRSAVRRRAVQLVLARRSPGAWRSLARPQRRSTPVRRRIPQSRSRVIPARHHR